MSMLVALLQKKTHSRRVLPWEEFSYALMVLVVYWSVILLIVVVAE